MTYPLWVVGGRPLVRGLDLGWGSETLRSHSLWDELVGGCLPFSVPKRNFCCAVSCALTIRSLGSEPGLLLFVQSRPTPTASFIFLCFQGLSFPNPTSSPSWSKGLSCGSLREELPRAAVQVRTHQRGPPSGVGVLRGRACVGVPEKGCGGQVQREPGASLRALPRGVAWTCSVPTAVSCDSM